MQGHLIHAAFKRIASQIQVSVASEDALYRGPVRGRQACEFRGTLAFESGRYKEDLNFQHGVLARYQCQDQLK